MTACINSRAAVNCIVTERCRWQEERGQDGAAVDRKTTLQGSFSSGTARDVVVGSSPTGGAKKKALAFASAFFSYIRFAANDIAKGSGIMLCIVLLFLTTLCEYNITFAIGKNITPSIVRHITKSINCVVKGKI